MSVPCVCVLASWRPASLGSSRTKRKLGTRSSVKNWEAAADGHREGTWGIKPLIIYPWRKTVLSPWLKRWCHFYWHDLTFIPAWITNHISGQVWDEITYPFPNFNAATVEVWEWISTFTPHFILSVITYPCLNLKLNHVSKKGPSALTMGVIRSCPKPLTLSLIYVFISTQRGWFKKWWYLLKCWHFAA